MKKPFVKIFRDVNKHGRKAFLADLQIENINRIKIASILGLIIAIFLIGLDILRYLDGQFAASPVYVYLCINHAVLFALIIPLIVIYKGQPSIDEGHFKYSYALIVSWAIFISAVTLSMAILSIIERGSIVMYAINIILINFVIIPLHFDRILLNVISYFIISISITLIYGNNLEGMVVNLLEAISFTILAFSISTNLFNTKVDNYRFKRLLQRKNETIETERKKFHELLLNTLPAKIADELILNKKVEPRHYSSATVMMIDFKGFSKISNLVTPVELVHKIDYCFCAFDQIIHNYGLEKIKTLGDGYLCVGGVPTPSTDHPEQTINAAIEILAFLAEWRKECEAKQEIYFEGRIGIHTGPLVAGIVGKSKFAFDVWGDTVNIAARLESTGEAGRINISKSTYQLLENRFDCTYRGKIPIKNQDPIDMYFLERKIGQG